MSALEDHLIWLKQVKEDILDPERPIIDPHHHLWPGELPYLLDDLWKDCLLYTSPSPRDTA